MPHKNNHHRITDKIRPILRSLRREIGENIYAVRKKRKIKLTKLARQTGLGVSLLDGLEMGRGELTLPQLATISWALNVSPWHLLSPVIKKPQINTDGHGCPATK